MENLELAIMRIMRQTTEVNHAQYELVLSRMHSTGMDTLFNEA